MPGKAIKPEVVKELQRQLNQELTSAHGYEALSIWCEAQNLKGFAHYFIKQASEEREHARRFIKHLLDRNVCAELAQVAAPRVHFESLLEVARQAQNMERENTSGVHACFETAQRSQDYSAQVLLHWFINEQVEEEDWTDEMVDRVERANCAGGFAELDRHIERYLTDEPSKPGK